MHLYESILCLKDVRFDYWQISPLLKGKLHPWYCCILSTNVDLWG